MDNYVPILRFKAAEKGAVRALKPDIRECCTPLLEFVPSDFVYSKAKSNMKAKRDGKQLKKPDLADKLIKISRDIVHYFAPGEVYIDFKLTDDHTIDELPLFDKSNPHPIITLSELLKEQQSSLFHPGVSIIPVTGLDRSEKSQNAAKVVCTQHSNGLCIRISRRDLENDQLRSGLQNHLKKMGISARSVDLIVDLEHADDIPYSYSEICGKIPSIMAWRSFVIISGSIPEDMSNNGDWQKNNFYEHPRDDYRTWYDQAVGDDNLVRRPSFGDYTVRHPMYSNTDGLEASASFYYTAARKWLVFRGERGSNEKASSAQEQYREHIKMLCRMKEFYSGDYSYGDKYLVKLQMGERVGTARSIIQAGINHHITVAVRQLVALS